MVSEQVLLTAFLQFRRWEPVWMGWGFDSMGQLEMEDLCMHAVVVFGDWTTGTSKGWLCV